MRRRSPAAGATGGGATGGSTGGATGGGLLPVRGAGVPRGIRRLTVVLFVLLLLAVVARLVSVPYVILRPGPAVDVLGAGSTGAPMVDVEDSAEHPTTGGLYFTTVAEYGGPGRDVSALDWALATVDPHAEVIPESVLYAPQQSRADVEAANTAAMTGSQEEAAAVALRALGRTVPEQAVVATVAPGMPAEGVVEAGDVVVAVDGTSVRAAADVSRLVRAGRPGAKVRLDVMRGGQRRTLAVPTAQSEGRRVVGVVLRPKFDLPVRVHIDPGNVGGPSAGLIFSLAVYDRLTPGPLLDGQRVAGTGAIADDGTVQPISGIRHKMVGAHEAGVSWFLAPEPNCAETTGAVPDGMTVVKVATFTQARDALAAIAAGRGGSLPRCG